MVNLLFFFSLIPPGAQAQKDYITTPPGNLKQCKCIIHVVGSSDASSIKASVLDVLQECEEKQMTSVAFPALGTGAGGLAATEVADCFLDAMADFLKANSASSLQMVKVVLFQQQMLNDFYTSMKKRQGTALPVQKSVFTKMWDYIWHHKEEKPVHKPVQKLRAFQLVKGIEPVIFSLCAEDQETVDKTKAWLQRQIEGDQAEKVIKDECISELEDTEMQKISDLQEKFQVSVFYQPPDPSIKIVGLTRDVMDVSSEIEITIKQLKDKKNREQAADLKSKLVEWRYKHGGNMVAFDKLANLELEEAKDGNKTQITVQSQGKQFTVNVRKQKAMDQHGNQVHIERIDNCLAEPEYWAPMGDNNSLEVPVQSGSSEYLDVQQKFQKTCKNRIVKIYRVQNKALWGGYKSKKQSFDAKNGTTNNEKQLFHGSDIDTVKQVNQHGFNRSYAGRNAAYYGNGTYFARDASYSASPTYAKKDQKGQQHMYLARVLTGVFCEGEEKMITPPAKDKANPTDLYDSVTDDVNNPSMFIIFNDVQAYPEYHIIFK